MCRGGGHSRACALHAERIAGNNKKAEEQQVWKGCQPSDLGELLPVGSKLNGPVQRKAL